MARDIKYFTEEERLKVVMAFLIDGLSHREIQSQILGIPAPTNGGGYEAMNILHFYNIRSDKKKILQTKDINDLIDKETGNYCEVLKKIKAYFDEEIETEKVIKGLKLYKTNNTEISVETKQRIGQDKLRQYILNIYSHECALCDIDKDDLLVCSHIVPWKMDKINRLNPKNAICLCALHDKLFDKGYFSLDENYDVKLGSKSDTKIINLFKEAKFKKPLENSPSIKLLKIHYDSVCGIT